MSDFKEHPSGTSSSTTPHLLKQNKFKTFIISIKKKKTIKITNPP